MVMMVSVVDRVLMFLIDICCHVSICRYRSATCCSEIKRVIMMRRICHLLLLYLMFNIVDVIYRLLRHS